jgi:SAM-dependent methyltransferase
VATRVIEIAECPACGGTDFAPETLPGGATLRRCRACDTVSAASAADPDEIYVDGYLKGEGGDFGLDLRGPGFQAYLRTVARRRLDLIQAAAPGARSLLDVGCGTGEVLLEARERGWSVQGVEPIEDASREAREERGLDVRTATLEESGLPQAEHDVVSAFHVLEHIADSRAFLSSLARWARPGGWVAIEVPNFDSSIRRYHGSNWSGLRPLEHVVHFTPATLGAAFERVGLRPVRVTTASYVGPPQDLDNAIADLAKFRWRPLVAPLSRRAGDRDGAAVPTRAGWALLRAMERVAVARGHGQVVVGVAQRTG